MRRHLLPALLGVALLMGFVASQTWADEQGRWFPETAHRIDTDHGFQAFWDAHNGALMLGAPLTEIVFEANVPTQYFERGRLEQRGNVVQPAALGQEQIRWRTLASQGDRIANDAFQRFWDDHEGALFLGARLGNPQWMPLEGASVRVQYFERGRLEEHRRVDRTEIMVGALGREVALVKGLIDPQSRPAKAFAAVSPDAPVAAFAPLLPTPTPTPAPTAALPAATARPKRPAAPIASGPVIDVNLSTQSLVAYLNGEPVYYALIATGKPGFETPTGTYGIYTKYSMQTMRGDENGESWVVPNVPNIMYINGGVALHGTYWHNMFGTGVRLSHGCINLGLTDAAWLYAWADVGTPVVVHY